MSDKDCPDERMVEWIEAKKQHGYFVLTREELDSRIDEAQKDAYAEGRKDEREEHTESVLISAWVESHGSCCPWPVAVNIVATVKGLSDLERDRLLDLDKPT